MFIFDTEIKYLNGLKSMVFDNFQAVFFNAKCAHCLLVLLEMLIECSDFLLVSWFLLSRQAMSSEMMKDDFKTHKTCSLCR